jgi:hypothetical protein
LTSLSHEFGISVGVVANAQRQNLAGIVSHDVLRNYIVTGLLDEYVGDSHQIFS